MKIAAVIAASLSLAAPLGQSDVNIGPTLPVARIDVQGTERDSRELEFRAEAERAVRAKLFDPEGARFEWPYGFSPDTLNGKYGYLTCGRVNARNRYGGYVGFRWFAALVGKDGRVASLVTADDDSSAMWTSLICKRKAKTLPPTGR